MNHGKMVSALNRWKVSHQGLPRIGCCSGGPRFAELRVYSVNCVLALTLRTNPHRESAQAHPSGSQKASESRDPINNEARFRVVLAIVP
jgi:hypothetical protein